MKDESNQENMLFFVSMGLALGTLWFVFFGTVAVLFSGSVITGLWVGFCLLTLATGICTFNGYRELYKL